MARQTRAIGFYAGYRVAALRRRHALTLGDVWAPLFSRSLPLP
jgi:hypothetical protein